MIRLFSYALVLVCCWMCFTSCASLPKGVFEDYIPPAPDYSHMNTWAALPSVRDSADAVPLATWQDVQDKAPVDVFFIHPTTYTGKAGQNKWNASLDDEKVNLRTDKYPIRYQASIFNGAGKVYAPRYRQAHLHCFYTRNKREAKKALDLAYADVKAAFQYYLDHYNQGRPFILAAHSQGTYHGKQLIRDFIDGRPLHKQFVVAYLAGLAVTADYEQIKPCSTPEETGCFCSWRTFKKGYVPPKLHFEDEKIVVTNPVTWCDDISSSSKSKHQGCVLRDFQTVHPQMLSTEVYKDLLWVNKPRFPGSFLLTTKNYHIADYNFFYADVRLNAQQRVEAFLR